MSILWNTLTGQTNHAVRVKLEENKSYRQIKFDLKLTAERASTFEKVALLGIAGAFGLVMLGATYSAEGRDQLGKAVSLVAIPLCVLSYDCYQASENIRSEVIGNPEGLMIIEDAEKPVKVNRVALRKCLLHKTVLFEPFLDLFIKACVKHTYAEVVIAEIEEA